MSNNTSEPGNKRALVSSGRITRALRTIRRYIAQLLAIAVSTWQRTAACKRVLMALISALTMILLRARARMVALDEHQLRHRREALLERLEDLTHEARGAMERWLQSHWDRLVNRYGKRKAQQVLLAALLIVSVVCGPLSLIGTLHVISSFGQSAGNPNLFDPHSNATSKVQPRPQPPTTQLTKHISLVNPPRPTAHAPMGKAPSHISHAVSLPMKRGTLPLMAGQAATFTGSDAQLEIDVPADAVTADDVAHANGGLALSISQIAPASGSNAGGSGRVSLGSYVIQVADGHGTLAKQGLRKPVTFKFHYGKGESALDLGHVVAIANQTLPDGVALAPVASSSPATPAADATPAPPRLERAPTAALANSTRSS